MADIRNYRDAEGVPVQPYYAAFMIEHGRQLIGGGIQVNLQYMRWINARWDEFCTPRGIPAHRRGLHAAEFTDWLQERVAPVAEAAE